MGTETPPPSPPTQTLRQVYATVGQGDAATSLGTGFERVASPDINLTPSWDNPTMFELYCLRETQRMPIVDLVLKLTGIKEWIWFCEGLGPRGRA